jgi:hypothetical protein
MIKHSEAQKGTARLHVRRGVARGQARRVAYLGSRRAARGGRHPRGGHTVTYLAAGLQTARKPAMTWTATAKTACFGTYPGQRAPYGPAHRAQRRALMLVARLRTDRRIASALTAAAAPMAQSVPLLDAS